MADGESDSDSFHSDEGEQDPKEAYKLHYLIWQNDYEQVARFIRSSTFELYEFERIDPRGRTPLHLGNKSF